MPFELEDDGNVGTEHEWRCEIERDSARARVRMTGDHEVIGIPALVSEFTVREVRAMGIATRWDDRLLPYDEEYLDERGVEQTRRVTPDQNPPWLDRQHVVPWTVAQRQRILRRLRRGQPPLVIRLTREQTRAYGDGGTVKTLERRRPKRKGDRGEQSIREDRRAHVKPRDRQAGGGRGARGARR